MRAVTAVCLLAALPLLGQHAKEGEKSRHPFIGDAKAIEAGKKLFASGCGACHGAEGQGGRGPNLRSQVTWHPIDDDTLYTAIQKGIKGAMPAANLPEDQAWQVVAFVRSLTAPAWESAPPGDVQAGEKLFWGGAGCSGCHGIRGRGGKLGPDLANAGIRTIAALRESIVDPDAELAQGYRPATVRLKSGRVLKGVARNLSNYSLQMQDEQGNLHLVAMEDVAELTSGSGSPMPKDYGKKLTRSEINDLVSYLSRQGIRAAEPARK